MKWSWKIGRLAGIDVYVHATFLLLLVWVGTSYYLENHNLADAARGLVFILALFGIVVLHELGHALAARHYGIATRDITLLPIGGVARLERMPEDPLQELVVALAGPAVNLALAGVCGAWLLVTGSLAHLYDVRLVGGHLVANLLAANLVLAFFNLLPAFPMDGGRVLRAMLAMRVEYVRATQIAASIGQALALGLGFVGLFTNPMLVFIALFVWVGAAQESSMIELRSALGGIPLARAMITQYQTLSPTDTLSRAAEHVLAGFQQDFPVVEGGHVVGLLTRHDLLKALAEQGHQTPVAEVMRRQFATADPHDMLEAAFRRLQEGDCHTLPVVRGGQLVGMLNTENVGEFLMIQGALEGRKPR